MKLKKRFHKDLSQYPTPSRERVLGAYAKPDTNAPTPHSPQRKKWLTAPMAVAMAILLTVGAAACGVIIHYLNSEVITENNTQLTEVPEGYVGIYTVYDLVKLQEDVEAGTSATHYILMSDITFTDADYAAGGICEGGWEPIRIDTAAYGLSPIVMFNGNGHVIRNLQCHTVRGIEAEKHYSFYLGLFSIAEYVDMTIINLGMEDCLFTIENTHPTTLSNRCTYNIGAIAGSANYIGSCYVDGMTVEIRADYDKEADEHTPAHADDEFLYINVGGIAGNTNYADACYAENVTIRVIAEGEGGAVKLRAGGIAGIATSALTCWTDETLTITAEGDNYAIRDTATIANLPVEYMIPTIMTDEAFDEMMTIIAEANSINYVGEPMDGTQSFNYKMTRAYYLRREEENSASDMYNRYTYDLLAQANELYRFVSRTDEWQDVLYVFDPTASSSEYERLGTVFLDAFGSEEAFREFCLQYNVRLGEISCYTFPEGATVTPKYAEGFDFTTLWTIVDGKPRLRIFTE